MDSHPRFGGQKTVRATPHVAFTHQIYATKTPCNFTTSPLSCIS